MRNNFFLSVLFILASLFIVLGFKDAEVQFFLNQIAPLVSQEFSSALSPTPQTVLGLQDQRYTVTKVIDGDTIEIDGGQKIRYIGIDTPETKHPTKGIECFGKEAAAFNKQLVLGKKVRLEKDVSETDRYSRLLRYVYLGDLFVNQYLVAQGYAVASSYPPDVKHQEFFREAEQEARRNNIGLWSACK